MRFAVLAVISLASVALAAPPEEKLSPGDAAQKKSAPKAKRNESQQTMTGCVDEQDGKYVLLDDSMLKKLVDLEAAGASAEDFFAKHVGHKVTIKGNKSAEAEGRFKVTSIQDIAAVCAPGGTNQ